MFFAEIQSNSPCFNTIFTYFPKKFQRCKSLIPQQCNCYIDTFVRLMYNHGSCKIDESNLLKPSISPGQISTNPWHNTEFDLFRAGIPDICPSSHKVSFFVSSPMVFVSVTVSFRACRPSFGFGRPLFSTPRSMMPKPGMSGAAQPNSNPKSNPVGRNRWWI